MMRSPVGTPSSLPTFRGTRQRPTSKSFGLRRPRSPSKRRTRSRSRLASRSRIGGRADAVLTTEVVLQRVWQGDAQLSLQCDDCRTRERLQGLQRRVFVRNAVEGYALHHGQEVQTQEESRWTQTR